MKCPNCGANVAKGAQFCPNCGNSLKFAKETDSTFNRPNNNSLFQDAINTILAKPKLIILVLVVIIVIFGIGSIFNSDGGTSSNGGFDTTVYGLNFHIPEGYVESSRSDLTNGEFADFKDDGYIIEISVSGDRNFKESKYIDSKVDMTINNKQGTLYQYKYSNGVAFVYHDNGNLVVIRGAGPNELKEIIV
jgi:hypothetical protein